MFLQPPSAIFVKVIDREPTTGFNLGDVLIRALGGAGVLLLGSLVLGVLLGGGFIAYRVWQRRREERNPIGAGLRVTP